MTPPHALVVPAVVDTLAGEVFAALFVSHEDAPVDVDTVSTLVAAGWHVPERLHTPPRPGPHGYRVRFAHVQGHTTAPGVVDVLDPDGRIVARAEVTPLPQWRPLLLHTGTVALFVGSDFLTKDDRDGHAATVRAITAGGIVAGTLPVEVAGPNNGWPPPTTA
ncbi:MAG: hypothetical protein HOV94_07200 [Saccharothrix sp.]|nr:hypothetical protein [Saccharothrix sp.]